MISRGGSALEWSNRKKIDLKPEKSPMPLENSCRKRSMDSFKRVSWFSSNWWGRFGGFGWRGDSRRTPSMSTAGNRSKPMYVQDQRERNPRSTNPIGKKPKRFWSLWEMGFWEKLGFCNGGFWIWRWEGSLYLAQWVLLSCAGGCDRDNVLYLAHRVFPGETDPLFGFSKRIRCRPSRDIRAGDSHVWVVHLVGTASDVLL